MDYGRSLLNWQNKIEGRPYARGGTGCACGIAGVGAAGRARAVLWRYENSPLFSVGAVASAFSSRVVGPLTGFDSNSSIAVVESLVPGANGGMQLAGASSYAAVSMLTTADGVALGAGEAVLDAEIQTAEIDDLLASMEDGVTGVTQIKGVDADAATRRARWYENTFSSYVDRMEYITDHQMFRLAVAMEIIKAAPDAENYKRRIADLRTQMQRNANRTAGLLQSMREWIVEANVQAKKAENQNLLARMLANFGRYGNTLSDVIDSTGAAASAAKTAAEGAKKFLDDADAATKAGLGGIAAIVGVGLVALLFIGGRRK